MKRILSGIIAVFIMSSLPSVFADVALPEMEDKENVENSENVNQDDEFSSNLDDVEDTIKEYSLEFTSVENATDSFNVQNYSPDGDEKETIYDTNNIIRRDGVSGEAYIIFEIPYVTDFYAISCHRPTDVAEFSFELSIDGESWEKAEVDINTITDSEKWTRVEYTLTEIENTRYVKVVWGTEKEDVHWWNPYFVGLFANSGASVATEVVIENDEEITIPIYDSKRILLSGKVMDQLGLDTEEEVIWSLISSDDERITISPENEVEILSDMAEGVSFTLKAENADGTLTAEKTFFLCLSMPADTNDDNVITIDDINKIVENYGKSADVYNRLCDINKDGLIDIVDLAYAARYMQTE